MSRNQGLEKRLKIVLESPDNQKCSECRSETKLIWAAFLRCPVDNKLLGVICCKKCHKLFRDVGNEEFSLISVNEPGDWSEDSVEALEISGNRLVNSSYEANLNTLIAKDGRDWKKYGSEAYFFEKFINRRFFDVDVYRKLMAESSKALVEKRFNQTLRGYKVKKIAGVGGDGNATSVTPSSTGAFTRNPSFSGLQRVEQGDPSVPAEENKRSSRRKRIGQRVAEGENSTFSGNASLSALELGEQPKHGNNNSRSSLHKSLNMNIGAAQTVEGGDGREIVVTPESLLKRSDTNESTASATRRLRNRDRKIGRASRSATPSEEQDKQPSIGAARFGSRNKLSSSRLAALKQDVLGHASDHKRNSTVSRGGTKLSSSRLASLKKEILLNDDGGSGERSSERRRRANRGSSNANSESKALSRGHASSGTLGMRRNRDSGSRESAEDVVSGIRRVSSRNKLPGGTQASSGMRRNRSSSKMQSSSMGSLRLASVPDATSYLFNSSAQKNYSPPAPLVD